MNQEGTTAMYNEEDFVTGVIEAIIYPNSSYSNATAIIYPISFSYIAILTVIFSVGTLGNLSLIWLFSRETRLQDVSHALISNLAVSDLLCILIYVPTLIYSDIHRYRPYGKYFCYLFTSLTYTSHDVSILSFVALSFVRHQIVLHPLSTLVKHAKYKTLVFCLCSWIVGISFSILPASHCQEITVPMEYSSESNSSRHVKQHYVSMDNNKYWKRYLPVRFVLLYVIPLLFIAVLHFKMAKKLLLDSSLLKQNPSVSAKRALSSRKRLGIIMILLIVSFALCWLPNYIVLYMVCFTIISIPQGLIRLRAALISLSFAINPMILYITSSTHRHFLRNHFINCSKGKAFARWSIGTRSSTTISTRDSSTKKVKKVNYDGLDLQAVQTVTASKGIKVNCNY